MTTHKSHGSLLLLLSCLLVSHWLFEAETSYGTPNWPGIPHPSSDPRGQVYRQASPGMILSNESKQTRISKGMVKGLRA